MKADTVVITVVLAIVHSVATAKYRLLRRIRVYAVAPSCAHNLRCQFCRQMSKSADFRQIITPVILLLSSKAHKLMIWLSVFFIICLCRMTKTQRNASSCHCISLLRMYSCVIVINRSGVMAKSRSKFWILMWMDYCVRVHRMPPHVLCLLPNNQSINSPHVLCLSPNNQSINQSILPIFFVSHQTINQSINSPHVLWLLPNNQSINPPHVLCLLPNNQSINQPSTCSLFVTQQSINQPSTCSLLVTQQSINQSVRCHFLCLFHQRPMRCVHVVLANIWQFFFCASSISSLHTVYLTYVCTAMTRLFSNVSKHSDVRGTIRHKLWQKWRRKEILFPLLANHTPKSKTTKQKICHVHVSWVHKHCLKMKFSPGIRHRKIFFLSVKKIGGGGKMHFFWRKNISLHCNRMDSSIWIRSKIKYHFNISCRNSLSLSIGHWCDGK